MGYMARCDGDITLLPGTDVNAVLTKICDFVDNTINPDDFEYDISDYPKNDKTKDSSSVITLWMTDYHYHSEEIEELLDLIKDYVSESKIIFEGDEDCKWRYRFDPENKTWIEENGIIYYNDEDMIDDLKAKGYIITKP